MDSQSIVLILFSSVVYTLINPYTIVGNFKENVYTPAGNDNN